MKYNMAGGTEARDVAGLLQQGRAQRTQGQLQQALASFEQALALDPEHPQTLIELGRTWRALKATGKALELLQRAVALAPRSLVAWRSLAATYLEAKAHQEAERCFGEALALAPADPRAERGLVASLLGLAADIEWACSHGDWSLYEAHGERLLAAHRARRRLGLSNLITPFGPLGFYLTPEEQREAAIRQAQDWLVQQGLKVPPARALCSEIRTRRPRIGYLSGDFRNHASGHLMQTLFAHHDRERFEVFAYSFGPDDGSRYRRAIERDAEHFVELAGIDDTAAAGRVLRDGIDILIDLMGFAGNHRMGIMARRPAPIQVSWLGYCVTTGASWIDYFVTDAIVSPAGSERHFTEPLVHLPDSYQVYGGEPLDATPVTRAPCGLPDGVMVYVCFNYAWKIERQIFTAWMAILEQVPGSVLWLLKEHPEDERNWRNAAGAAGLDPARLVFAPIWSKPRHLARHRLADLFLDTPHCNAHTTASDALWAGLPVLTAPGPRFAQRVAASVVTAAGLPELVVADLAAYTAEAIRLGHDRAALERHKQRLIYGRERAVLFDVARFTRNLEHVLLQLLQRER